MKENLNKEFMTCCICGEDINPKEEYDVMIIDREKETSENVVEVLYSEAIAYYHIKCSPFKERIEKNK